jgi:O-antigen ligase
MLVISLYCAYKSYTRSILLALFILWSFGLFGIKNKYFIIFLVCGLIISFAFRTNLQEIFFKSTKEVEINVASSGRAYLWEHNIDLFKSYALYEKVLGRGLGVGSVTVIGKEDEIWSSHNDYLHLLMQLGIIGLSLFLLIHWAIINEILSLRNKKKVKFFYLGFILSIIFVNFASGIITYQLPTAQLFWLVMGLFYHITLELNTEIEIK